MLLQIEIHENLLVNTQVRYERKHDISLPLLNNVDLPRELFTSSVDWIVQDFEMLIFDRS